MSKLLQILYSKWLSYKVFINDPLTANTKIYVAYLLIYARACASIE